MREIRQRTTVSTSIDPDLVTRTSWVDAYTAYVQIAKGRAAGSRHAVWIRWQLQWRLFRLGCFIQTHAGKVLFLAVLLLSLCCVGLKTAALETSVERLWVEEGGRLSGELAYTLRWLGEGSGTTYELVIQTPRRVDQEVDVDTRSSASTKNVLSVRSMLQHLEAVRAATTLSVELFDVTWSFRDICYAISFPVYDDNGVINKILDNLQACVIITPLDCFWEGSKLLGPEYGVFIPGYSFNVKWSNLDPLDVVQLLGTVGHSVQKEFENLLQRAGISRGYQDKPCLDPYDAECPSFAPNFGTKELPDVGAELTGGCSGLSTKYLHWEEDLIVGGAYHGKTGQLRRAEALQSLLQLLGEKDLFDYHRDTYKVHGVDWTVDKARQVLDAWRRKFTQTVLASQNTSTAAASDDVHGMSSLDLSDVMDDFSQMNVGSVVVACLLMCVYACVSLVKCNSIQSQATVGLVGVLLVILSAAAGLGICSVIGIKFNAATTQILPFLALGLGMDDMFLITHEFSLLADKPNIDRHELTGECLKRIGVTVLLTSFCNGFAFFLAAIIPIPAMRAFCLQCAVLVVFNMATMLLVFPAVISLDMIRRRKSRVDLFCCFTWTSLEQSGYPGTTSSHSVAARLSSSESVFSRRDSDASQLSVGSSVSHNVVTHVDTGGSNPCSSLSVGDIPLTQHATTSAASLATPSSTTSSSQHLAGSLPELSSCSSGGCSHLKQRCTQLTLNGFARGIYAPLLAKTAFKAIVVSLFVTLTVASIIGIIRMRDGLDLTDIVPRGTNEHRFLEAQSQYFGFYNFYAVTKDDFDYTSADNQKLLYDYHHAFLKIDNIVKKEDGSLPDFWLQEFRSWLLGIQDSFDDDVKAGHISHTGWNSSASAMGRLGYKLLLQTGEVDNPVDVGRFDSGRLVSSNRIIYPPAFYIYLSAWCWNDGLAYVSSMAAIRPQPKEWYHDENDRSMKIPKSQPIAYAQLAFYLHRLGDTDAVTATIEDVRSICESFTNVRGLPNYPHGIIFTFWEQYVSLRFYMTMALVAALAAIFVILAIILLNVVVAFFVVVVLGMIVMELFGLMGLLGIQLSAIPAVILVITAGVGVEFTVHVCLTFLTSIGSSRSKRAVMTLEPVFSPVVHGAISTLLGVVMLAVSQFDFIVRYFFVILVLLVALGVLNGLLLLPVLLSITGPRSEVRPLDNGDRLPVPSPKMMPKKARRDRVHMRRRHSMPRVDPPVAELALSTIAEESSQNHSMSSVSIDVDPEVFIESPMSPPPPPPYTGVAAPTVTVNSPPCCVCHAARGAPSATATTSAITLPSTSGHHVIRTTARVKVEVHTPVPILSRSSPDFKSKKRKLQRPEEFSATAAANNSPNHGANS